MKLFFFLLLLPSIVWGSPAKVEFKTPDGEKLIGLFEAPKPNKPFVIMLHGLAAWKDEWAPLMAVLAQEGWGYLAYDARGHGLSSRSKSADGSPDGFRYFGSPNPGSAWEKMIDDIGSAIRFLSSERKIKRETIFLAGASLGANDALNFSALSIPPQGLILLSPGLNYQGILTEKPIQKVRCPVLIVSSQADLYAYQSSKTLKKLNPKVDFWSDVKPGHGVQMFDENLLKRLMAWLQAKNSEK